MGRKLAQKPLVEKLAAICPYYEHAGVVIYRLTKPPKPHPGSGNYPRHPKPAIERFWEQVDKSASARGCWFWTGALSAAGYGLFSGGHNKLVFAHRFSYRIHKGEPLHLHVLHRCDTPKCVNPDHLFLGTQRDNGQDMAAKGRGTSKLSAEQAHEVRSLSKAGTPQRVIARQFGLTQTAIWYIIHRKTYTHVKD